jgi:hypothetical protein
MDFPDAHPAWTTQLPAASDLDIDGLCAWAATNLGIDGATVSIVDAADTPAATWTTDPLGVELVALDLTVGDGPCSRARCRRGPVLVGDVQGPVSDWSPFGAEVRRLGVGALFAFPLLAADDCIGTLLLYRRAPGPLAGGGTIAAEVLAARTVEAVLGTVALSEDLEALPTSSWDVVHQATGMVMAQLRLGAEDARLRLRSHAFRAGRPLLAVASDVIAADLVFFRGSQDD